MSDEIKQTTDEQNLPAEEAVTDLSETGADGFPLAQESAATGDSAEGDKKDEGGKKKNIKRSNKKELQQIPHGQVHIKASYNNTIITVTDEKGCVIAWASAGSCGFKGPKKATPYAATIITRDVIEKAKPRGIKEVDVFVRGVGQGRESAIRAINANGLQVLSIRDITSIPHNGCRLKKPRRV